jgi:hypothetical protein
MGEERQRGQYSKTVRGLLGSLCFQNGSVNVFKEGIRKVLSNSCGTYQIASIIRAWVKKYQKENDVRRILYLTNAVDPKIRAVYTKHFPLP